jgi:hypothetical protein
MNRHELADLISLNLAGLEAGRTRFFEQTVESLPFRAHLEAVRLDPLPGPMLGAHEVPTSTLVGTVDAAYLIYRWKGAAYPTIIYHHGNRERTFEMSGKSKNTFRTILADGTREIDANLVAIRAPFHRMATREYLQRMGTIENFLAMLAASTALIERIVYECREGGCNRIMVAGLSLGGTVANLRLLGRAGRHHPEAVQELLNFTSEYLRVRDNNVFPLLARYDQYVPFELQEECYVDRPVRVMERGHITAALSPELLRRHVVDVLQGQVPTRNDSFRVR